MNFDSGCQSNWIFSVPSSLIKSTENSIEDHSFLAEDSIEECFTSNISSESS